MGDDVGDKSGNNVGNVGGDCDGCIMGKTSGLAGELVYKIQDTNLFLEEENLFYIKKQIYKKITYMHYKKNLYTHTVCNT